jgi:acyl-CoA synthetase (NDP forming)
MEDESSIPKEENGSLALISQSGALEIVLSNLALIENLRLSKVICYDNREDLDARELIQLAEDQEIKAILLRIEATQRGRAHEYCEDNFK